MSNTWYDPIRKRAFVPSGGVFDGLAYQGAPPADVLTRAGLVRVTAENRAQIEAEIAEREQAEAAAGTAAARQAVREQLANDPILATIAETRVEEIARARGVTQKQVRDAMLARLEAKLNA
jgi:hypothetical protein